MCLEKTDQWWLIDDPTAIRPYFYDLDNGVAYWDLPREVLINKQYLRNAQMPGFQNASPLQINENPNDLVNFFLIFLFNPYFKRN